MSKLKQLINKSQHSFFYKRLLNFILARNIPFNAPHSFNVERIESGNVTISLPYKRTNLNHVKGIHACALATLCEFTTGLTLITIISESEYRIILKSLRIDYHYQARASVQAQFNITNKFVNDEIVMPLQSNEAVFHEFEINVYDILQNHICTGYVNWQIKKWNKVKTKV